MIKNVILSIFAAVAFNQQLNAAKLMVKNNSDYDIVVYQDHEWTTVTVNKGESTIALVQKGPMLKAFTAFKKGDMSETLKKFKLKQQFLDEFNRHQKQESQEKAERELLVNFPEDFDAEVSLRTWPR